MSTIQSLPDQPNSTLRLFTETSRHLPKKFSPNQFLRELLSTIPRKSTSFLLKLKSSTETQSPERLKSETPAEAKLSPDQEDKSSTKLTSNQLFKEKALMLSSTEDKTKPSKWTQSQNQPNTTPKAEPKP